MSTFEVHVVNLEPLRVASFHGFGEGPEELAWQKLAAWAEPRGLLDFSEAHRIFGFNNPNPSPGSANYGYEYWLEVGPEVSAEGAMEIKDFPGGLYAVARCEVVGDAYQVIPATWQQLVTWREDSAYKEAGHQWLEKHLRVDSPGLNFVLELYLPIAE